MLLVLPTIVAILFWRLQILRRYRLARWLLAPFVYVGAAVLGLIVGQNLGWYTDIAPSRAQYTVKLADWKNHPDVKSARQIYDEIRIGIKEKKYITKVRKYDVESPSCATYPIKSETLVLDTANRVRLYQLEQIGSHREPFTVERYYDSTGTLRFVYVDRVITNVRIYLNSAGNVIWAVEQNGEKFTTYDSSNEDWEMKPNSANMAREEFQGQQLCQEITK
ncbi:MAG: hypothetical protein AABY62_02540 [Pseudomonadota bacterium]